MLSLRRAPYGVQSSTGGAAWVTVVFNEGERSKSNMSSKSFAYSSHLVRCRGPDAVFKKRFSMSRPRTKVCCAVPLIGEVGEFGISHGDHLPAVAPSETSVVWTGFVAPRLLCCGPGDTTDLGEQARATLLMAGLELRRRGLGSRRRRAVGRAHVRIAALAAQRSA